MSIDDTLTEKFGEKFACWGKLYDHAAHNGLEYLNGHCFVSLMLSVPLKAAGKILSFPVAYRMRTKEQSKLEMAQVILCCDSWDLQKNNLCGYRSDE